MASVVGIASINLLFVNHPPLNFVDIFEFLVFVSQSQLYILKRKKKLTKLVDIGIVEHETYALKLPCITIKEIHRES